MKHIDIWYETEAQILLHSLPPLTSQYDCLESRHMS